MRKTLLLVMTCIFYQTIQAQSLQFTYDEAGNQIKRELVTVTVTTLSSTISDNLDVTNNPYSMDITTSIVEAYPNPVIDLLNIAWPVELQIAELALFDNNGKMLQFKRAEYGNSNIVFDMSSYASGMYYIRLFDVRRQSKTIKIIKK